MTLALATDSAYPYNFAQRPAGCQVIMGYVGRPGYTPHVWTLSEARAARATGCQWWPIGVGISRGATSAQDGHDLARYMISVLPGYGVDKSTPVFQDLEPDALRADTGAAAQCVAAWKADMRTAGYQHPFTYSVDASFIDWLARWDNVRPTTLPAGKIGVQYAGNISPPTFDLSVFDPTLLGGPEDMTPDEHQMLVDLHNWFRPPNTGGGQINAGGTIASTLNKVNGLYNLPRPPTAAQIAAAVVAALTPLSLTAEQLQQIADAVLAAAPGPVPYSGILTPVPPA